MSVADDSELVTLGWSRSAAAAPGLAFVETRSVTLTAPGRHEHARWALALEEAHSWTEQKEREVKVGWLGVGGWVWVDVFVFLLCVSELLL